MMKAIWNNEVIAESNDTIVVEGNHYFPLEAVKKEFLQPSHTHTTCPWKRKASYYSIEVDGNVNNDAGWYYPEPKETAKQIKDHIAFGVGLQLKSKKHDTF